MRFLYPYFAFLIILVFFVYFLKFKKKSFAKTLAFSKISIKNSSKFTHKIIYLIEIIAFVFLILALMRPQTGEKSIEQSFSAYSIMVVMDNSTSMLAADLKPSRFDVAKKVISEFISKRKGDLIGLTIFAGESVTLIPITLNHQMIIDTLKNLKMGILEDGTAIGMGLISAISSLKESKAKTKTIVILTDGNNNMGDISPEEATKIAKEFGIKIYTIGVGALNEAPYPVKTPFGIRYVKVKVNFNEEILKKIAKETGGLYFRATDNKKMKMIFEQIDKLEKNRFKINLKITYKDKFQIPLTISLLMFLIAFFLEKFIFVITEI